MPTFTRQMSDMKTDGPVVDVEIGVGTRVEDTLIQQGRSITAPVKAIALIDTGASVTCVNEGIIRQLNLVNPVGSTRIKTPTHAGILCYQYVVRIMFPPRVLVEAVVTMVTLRNHNVQCLICRDILSGAIFIYSGGANTFSISF